MRSKTIIMVLASLVVAVLAVSSFASAAGGEFEAGQGPSENGQEGMGFQGEMTQEQINEMLQTGEEIGLMAQINYQNGMTEGGFVSFELDEGNSTVADFTLIRDENVTVFEEIVVSLADPTVSTMGAVMKMTWDETELILHDNPASMFHIMTNDTLEVSFKLADGMQVTEAPTDCVGDCDLDLLIIYGDDFESYMRAGGDFVIDEGEDGTYLNVTLTDEHLIFRAMPNASYQNQLIQQAMLDDLVGAEVSLMVQNGNAAFDVMNYQYGLRTQVQDASKDHLRLQVTSENNLGQVMILTLDKGVMQMDRDRLRVQIDDEDVECKEITEVLDGGDEASYAVIEGEETDQMLVYFPEVSSNILTVESVSPLDNVLGSEGLMAIAGAVAIVIVAVFLIRRR